MGRAAGGAGPAGRSCSRAWRRQTRWRLGWLGWLALPSLASVLQPLQPTLFCPTRSPPGHCCSHTHTAARVGSGAREAHTEKPPPPPSQIQAAAAQKHHAPVCPSPPQLAAPSSKLVPFSLLLVPLSWWPSQVVNHPLLGFIKATFDWNLPRPLARVPSCPTWRPNRRKSVSERRPTYLPTCLPIPMFIESPSCCWCWCCWCCCRPCPSVQPGCPCPILHTLLWPSSL